MKQFVLGFGQFVNEMLEPTCECGGAIMEDGTCAECGAKQEELTAAAQEFDKPSEFPEITEAKKPPFGKPFEKGAKKPTEKGKPFAFGKPNGKDEKDPAKPAGKTGPKLSKSEQARKNFGLDKKK
jgi:hypothetical protein